MLPECTIITAPRYIPWLPLVLLGVLLLAGCPAISTMPGNNRPERSEPEGLAGAPGKQSFRVSQFVFLSDFPLSRDLPIFKDLGVLREQLYKELRLPPSSTEVFVYLFEDRDRYEKFMKA